MWNCQLKSPEEMKRWAASIPRPCVIAIDGPLGAGKTVFAQGLGQALHIEAHIVSPTFTIANQYPAPIPFLHIDLYRLEDFEATQLGLDEEIEAWEGMVLIEWASKYPELLPLSYIHIQLSTDPDHPTWRQAELVAYGQSLAVLQEWMNTWTPPNA